MAKTRRRVVTSQSSSTQNPTVTYIIAGSIILGLVGLGYIMWLSLRPAPQIRGVVTYPLPSRGHDELLEIPFEELPPVGGEHNPIWQNCGIYNEPVRAENVVHSMEHGAVWITYQPDLPQEDIDSLQDYVRGQNFVVLSPYPNQRSPIVLTSWSVQLEVDSADDDRIEQFVERFRVGPRTPERGGACTSGTGDPIN